MVRHRDGVEITWEKPEGLDIAIGEEYWVFKRNPDQSPFVLHIGKSGELRYSDEWHGPIGVYDLSKKEHVKTFLEQAQFHRDEILNRQLQCKLRAIFGKDAEIAEGYLIKNPIEQKQQKLTQLQEIYLSCRQMAYDIPWVSKQNVQCSVRKPEQAPA